MGYRAIRVTSGFICLAFGVAGLILPILQGWFFLALGVVLLSKDILLFSKAADWMRRRFPFLDKSIQKARGRIKRFKSRLR